MENIEAVEDQEILELIRELEKKQREERQLKLDILGSKIAKIRNEAVSERQGSGFEAIWLEDEEFYNGIDDLNRGKNKYVKPRTTTGGLTSVSSSSESGDAQCIEFFNITRPFSDAAEARLCDMLLPHNDWPFHIKPTPVPEFDKHEDDDRPMIVDPSTGQPFSVGEVIKTRNKEVGDKVEKAEDQIKDWLVETNYKTECRSAISAAIQVGTGILKGPYPVKRTHRKVIDGELIVEEIISPASKCISHWDFFPDMNCGEDVQDGDYVIERDYLTARQLRNLKGVHGYDDSAIDKVLKEGPGRRNISSNNSQTQTQDNDRFEVWYYYGTIDQDDLKELDEDFACRCDEEEEAPEPVNAIIVMVNDTVIQGIEAPLDNYGYPFDVMVWKRIPGQPFGAGVAREGRTAQKTVLAAYRTLMENMGLASVPMIAMLRSALDPVENGNYSLHKGKRWLINEDSGVRNANEAIQTIIIPAMQKELTELIQLGSKMMEDSTGITFLMQGQQGSAPDTVGGMQMMLQSSSAILRNATRIFDQKITIPHINRYYGWLLMHGEDDLKADLMIEATGSASLAEREIQSMQLPQIMQYAMNPAFELSPKKTLQELLKSMKFEPSKFDLDEKEKQALANAKPVSDPRVQVEEMRTQKDLQIAEAKNQIEQMRIQKDTDRDALYSQGVTERNQITYQSHIEELQLRKELAMLEYATQHQMQLEDIKAKLADSSMKLSVQKELANVATTPAKQVITPPSEPPQRAPKGEAFQQ